MAPGEPTQAASVNVHEAKTHFSKLLARVQDGEEIIIARSGTPIARLVRIAPPKRSDFFGSLASQIEVPADDVFNADPDDERLWGYR